MTLEYFLSRSKRIGECLIWQAAVDEDGYPVYWRAIHPRRRKAHRAMLEIKLGRSIREGYCACHKCDNRKCIEPDHLFEGTHSENTQDYISKGRHRGRKMKGLIVGNRLEKIQN